MKVEDEKFKSVKQDLDFKTIEFDTAHDALCQLRESNKETHMVTDVASTSTVKEANIGHGCVQVQG